MICLPGEQVLDAATGRPGSRRHSALCVISAGFAETGAEGRDRQERLLALVRAHGARLVGPELPRNRRSGTRPERDVRAPSTPGRERSGSRRRAARSGSRSWRRPPSAISASQPSSRSATRPTCHPTTCSSGGRTTTRHRPRPPLSRVVRQSTRVLSHRTPRRPPQADPRPEGRFDLAPARGRPARTPRRSPDPRRPSTRCSIRPAYCAPTRWRSSSTQPRFSHAAAPGGRRVGVITNAGGLGILCADACEAAGLELPTLTETTRAAARGPLPVEASLGNPIDLLGSATAATYRAALDPLLADPNLDAIIALFVPPVVAGANEVAVAIREAVEAIRLRRSPSSPPSSAPKACHRPCAIPTLR